MYVFQCFLANFTLIIYFYRNALVTDGFLNVKNVENVFGIGDCATVQLTKLLSKVEELFKLADKDGSGELTLDEFSGTCQD